ncbi:MAG TPA: DoxX family protein [Mycobacterium sp.]|nr:DoxX family protein [Mycobacterium sp.]HTX93874.1 DoxX family protein [Mycobacterium sp.]
MNTVLWILQIVLAVVFAGAGAVKLIAPRDQLAKTLGGWVYDVPAWLPKPLGVAELLGAIGLIVPPLVHIAPILTPIAASALAVTMIGAIVVHARRGEFANVAVNVVLAVMAAVVAWGRFGPYAF